MGQYACVGAGGYMGTFYLSNCSGNPKLLKENRALKTSVYYTYFEGYLRYVEFYILYSFNHCTGYC